MPEKAQAALADQSRQAQERGHTISVLAHKPTFLPLASLQACKILVQDSLKAGPYWNPDCVEKVICLLIYSFLAMSCCSAVSTLFSMIILLERKVICAYWNANI